VTAFNIRVPVFIKRTLTSMQITQFLVGGSGAMIHSFLNYNIPVISSSQTDAPASSASAAANNGSVVAATGNLLSTVKDTFAQQNMPCITSSGQTFAVWLNVFYLAPLTYLFVSFFIESYLRRSNQQPGRRPVAAARRMSMSMSNNVQLAEKAGWEAAKNVEREVYGESAEEAAVSSGSEGKSARGAKAAPAASGRVLRSRN
jgi:hypothetical protein